MGRKARSENGQQPAGQAAMLHDETTAQLVAGQTEARPVAKRAEQVMLPVELIDDRHNLRIDFDEAFIQQLSGSIRQIGLMEPLIVRKLANVDRGEKKYKLVAGHQRLAAAKLAGQDLVEARVYEDVDDEWEARARLAENVQRKDLNHIELALAFGHAQEAGLSVSQIAAQANLSDDHVRRHLWLLKLADPVRQLVSSGRLPIHQAELIAHVGNHTEQIELAGRTVSAAWVDKKQTWERDCEEKDDGFVLPVTQLRRDVSFALRGLAGCGWLKQEETDAAAISGGRRCVGCQDNTITHAGEPTLFGDLSPQGSPKKGYCTDKGCFELKAAAWEKVAEKRRREEERETAKKVAKAKKAGLAVCDICAAIETSDTPLQKKDGRTLCKKCLDREAKRSTGNSNGPKFKRPFPQTDEEKLAVGRFQAAERIIDAIKEWAADDDILTDTDFLARFTDLLAINAACHKADSYYAEWPIFGFELSIQAEQFPKLPQLVADMKKPDKPFHRPAGILEGLAVMNVPDRPEYSEYTGKTQNVPTPPATIQFIECLEAFCQRHGIDAAAVAGEKPKGKKAGRKK